MIKFYNIFNWIILVPLFCLLIFGTIFLTQGTTIFSKILFDIIFCTAAYLCYKWNKNNSKNLFLYILFSIPGWIFIHSMWYFIPYVMGATILSDYITKDGIFGKKVVK